MGLVLTGIGALFGFAFASTSSGFFGAVFGACVGFAIAEILAARRRIGDLESSL
jgi:membrane associated rhomboid family serine protease